MPRRLPYGWHNGLGKAALFPFHGGVIIPGQTLHALPRHRDPRNAVCRQAFVCHRADLDPPTSRASLRATIGGTTISRPIRRRSSS